MMKLCRNLSSDVLSNFYSKETVVNGYLKNTIKLKEEILVLNDVEFTYSVAKKVLNQWTITYMNIGYQIYTFNKKIIKKEILHFLCHIQER